MGGYFDFNATAPLRPEAREAWLKASMDYWHNASGLYREAGAAKRLLEESRERIAEHLGAEPEQLVFTSGATEANGALIAQASRKSGVFLHSQMEHPSVLEAAQLHFGARARGLATTEFAEFLNAGRQTVALVSVMAANNETGRLLPWQESAAACRERGIPHHIDAAQWVGRLPSEPFGTCGSFVTGCAHKFGGTKGVGFLLVPKDQSFVGQVGGPQEGRRRAGTEDVAGVAAMAAALDAASAQLPGDAAGRDAFERDLVQRLAGVDLVAQARERLWNTSLFLLPPTINHLKFVARLSAAGFASSTGSACSAGKNNPSAALAAEGIPAQEHRRAVRLSSGTETSKEAWQALLEATITVTEELLNDRPRDGLDLANL